MYHPWRHLRSLSDWTLVWTALPGGLLGNCHWATKTITIRPGLLQAQRRSVLAHELVHVERGPFSKSVAAREELAVAKQAARRLISIRDLGEAMAWSTDLHEIADELWVDTTTVRTRLQYLHPGERGYLERRLDDGQAPR